MAAQPKYDPAAPNEPAFEPLHPLPQLADLLGDTDATVIADADQVSDHAGKPVPPLTPHGVPLRWKIRLPGVNVYTLTADEALACFLDDHDPSAPSADASAIALDAHRRRQRVRHLQGLIMNHVAATIMGNELPPEQMTLMQRCAQWGGDQGPLTETDCPEWTHPVPLLMFADAYDAAATPARIPPGGNVVLIRTFTAEEYLTDLARHGFVHLEQNPVYTPSGVSSMSFPTPEPDAEKTTDPGQPTRAGEEL